MNVLVTGAAGFVGSNLVPFLIQREMVVSTLDMNELPVAQPDLRIQAKYRLGSFRDEAKQIADSISDVTHIVHLASQSHVDRSISSPRQFIEDNVNGTLELFEVARHLPDLQQIILFSTDEVGACKERGEFTESEPFNCGSVYSASKGAQELLAQAYIKTHSLPIVTTRCVNIFGPGQADEKFLPTIIRKAIADEKIPIYGSGYQAREWVHVDHVCDFLNWLVTASFIPPKTILHITGTKELPNIVMAQLVLGLLGKLGKGPDLIEHVTDRLGHDVRYALGRDETDHWDAPTYENRFMEDLVHTVKHYEEKLNGKRI